MQHISSLPHSSIRACIEGTVGTGCTIMVCGQEVVANIDAALRNLYGLRVSDLRGCRRFRFANGTKETSYWIAMLPIGIGTQSGLLNVSVVPGSTPLLSSDGLLEDLDAVVYTHKGRWTLASLGS